VRRSGDRRLRIERRSASVIWGQTLRSASASWSARRLRSTCRRSCSLAASTSSGCSAYRCGGEKASKTESTARPRSFILIFIRNFSHCRRCMTSVTKNGVRTHSPLSILAALPIQSTGGSTNSTGSCATPAGRGGARCPARRRVRGARRPECRSRCGTRSQGSGRGPGSGPGPLASPWTRSAAAGCGPRSVGGSSFALGSWMTSAGLSTPRNHRWRDTGRGPRQPAIRPV